MRRTLDRWTFTSAPVGPPAARPPYTVRPYDLEDAGEAFRLFQACFLQQRERAEWAWKFERMLTNPQPPFHVVEAGGQLVGMYPVRTLRLQVGDRVRLAPQCQDVCIDPAHRGGRIIRALLRANEEAWKAADVPLIFGFPTAEHMKVGARLLGYLDLFHLQVWSRRLARGLRLQARLPFDWARRLAYGAGVALQELNTTRRSPRTRDTVRLCNLPCFEASIDLLWSRFRSQVRFATVRDATYLTWRYVDRPGGLFRVVGATRDGRLEGYCVFRDNLPRVNGSRDGVLMDLVAIDPAVAKALLGAALARMRAARCGFAWALIHPAMLTAPVLAEAGFVPDLADETIIFSVKPYASDLDMNALRRPENWLLAFGDTDGMG